MKYTFIERMPPEWIAPPGGVTLETKLLPGAYIYEPDKLGFPVLSHPLCHQIMYVPFQHDWTNRGIKQKHQRMREFVDIGKAHKLMWFYERPYRNDIMYVLFLWGLGHEDYEYNPLPGLPPSMDDFQKKAYDAWMAQVEKNPAKLWKLAKETWTDNENIYQNVSDWESIYREKNSGELWMGKKELELRKSMPKEIEVWRGECNDGGWSWSLQQETGEFFARRPYNESTGEVIHARVPSELVFSYFGGRGEAEVIILEEDLTEFELERYSVRAA